MSLQDNKYQAEGRLHTAEEDMNTAETLSQAGLYAQACFYTQQRDENTFKLIRSRIDQLLKPILWDYDVDPYEFMEVALGKEESVGPFTRENALFRTCSKALCEIGVRSFGRKFHPGLQANPKI